MGAIDVRLACGIALFLAGFQGIGALQAFGQDNAAKERPRIAVLEFKLVEVEPAEGAVMTDRLRSDLVQTGAFVVLDRGQSDRILEELERQETGLTDVATATRIGEQFNVQRLVTGRVVALKDLAIVQANVEMIDMRTAEILLSETITHEGGMRNLILQKIPALAQRLAGTEPEPEPPLVKQPEANAPPAVAGSAPAPSEPAPPQAQAPADTGAGGNGFQFGLAEGFGCLTITRMGDNVGRIGIKGASLHEEIRLGKPFRCLRLAPGEYVVTRYNTVSTGLSSPNRVTIKVGEELDYRR